jgi:hypothetical protein
MAYVVIKNCGQTPAYDLGGWITLAVGGWPLTIELQKIDDDVSKGRDTIGPDGTATFTNDNHLVLEAEELSTLGTPQKTVYVYGEVAYKDIYAVRQTLEYRYMGGGPKPPVVTRTDGQGNQVWSLGPDSGGNKAT